MTRKNNVGAVKSDEYPSHLRLHADTEAMSDAPQLARPAGLDQLCCAFRRATGWVLRWVPGDAPSGDEGAVWSQAVAAGIGPVAGHLSIEPGNGPEDAVPTEEELSRARPLAAAIGGILDELQRHRHALWQREAELATAVPTRQRPDEEVHLAERLAAVLRGGAQSVDCTAAALYLLDDATSELKLRAAWGIPPERLLATSRRLADATADLEALAGHAVVLENPDMIDYWAAPEPCQSAVCVPVSSPSIPLGTLWMYCDEAREFTDQQTNLVEIIAGRLAADLEREVLLASGAHAHQLQREWELVARSRHDQLPSAAPTIPGWTFSGWAGPDDDLHGGLYDWSVLQDGAIAIAAGASRGTGMSAALGATTLLAAHRAYRCQPHSVVQQLRRLNRSLWSGSEGGQLADVGYAVIQPERGLVTLANAGRVTAVLTGSDGCRVVRLPTAPLGADYEFDAEERQVTLAVGDALVWITDNFSIRSSGEDSGGMLNELTRRLHSLHGLSADQLRTAVENIVDFHGTGAALQIIHRGQP